MALSRVPGKEDLFVGGIFGLRKPESLTDKGIKSVLSVIKYSFEDWGEAAKQFRHMSIDVNDVDEEDLLVHFSSAVQFIEHGLYPSAGSKAAAGEKPRLEGGTLVMPPPPISPGGGVLVHCAMGKSRSVSCVVAWLLYKYPARFGGKKFGAAGTATTAERHEVAGRAVFQALQWVRRERPLAEPNSGFMRQLEMWWEMGCPANDDHAVENHPIYQKWLYENKLKEARDLGMAPDAEWIRFEDEKAAEEVDRTNEAGHSAPDTPVDDGSEVRCKKCRRVLANSRFVVEHARNSTAYGRDDGGGGDMASSSSSSSAASSACPHIFIDTLSWMRPALEGGALDGRLNCPNEKCGATIGRFAWQGFKCSCGRWECPAFSLNRSRVDEVSRAALRAGGHGIRMPPGRNGSL